MLPFSMNCEVIEAQMTQQLIATTWKLNTLADLKQF